MRYVFDKKRAGGFVWLLLGVLFAVYSVIVYMGGSGTLFFAVWIMGAAVCLFMMTAKFAGLWEKVPNALRKASFVTFGLLFAFFLLVEGFILSGFSEKGESGLDYIIVPGARVYTSGPSVVLKYRLDRALEYLSENPGALCIVSGGQGGNEPFAEAVGMKDYLVKHGLPEDKILVEDKSLNTVQNMRYSAAILKDRGVDTGKAKIGIVTNNFHVFRCKGLARKAGFENACAFSAGSKPLYLPNNMLREFIGVLKDKLLGNM